MKDGPEDSSIAMIDAMMSDYRDKRFREIPPDTRRIDPDRLRYLRERLTNEYAYRWRSVEANGELVDVLYHTIKPPTGSRMGLSPQKILLNDKGQSPHPRDRLAGRDWPGEPSEFQVYYYITASSRNVLDFIQKFEDAIRLLVSLLPDYGYCLRSSKASTAVRLERDGYEGPWIQAGYPAVAVVLAVLDHLERFPQEAAHWPSI